jgi:hypothetical protein
MSRTETPTPLRPRRRRSLQLAIAATFLLLSVGVATAAATSNIEGVWSFNGGQIAIQPEGNGKYEGIVVSPTTFATCTHPNGQQIWKQMTLQSDGSYWGFHQWYYANTSPCVENPTLGKTAWRVIEESNGARYLRVCLSEPGKEQPIIPPGSAGTDASFGCVSSSLTAVLPTVTGTSTGGSGSGGGTSGTTGNSGVASFQESLTLPSARKCLSVRNFQVHLQDPTYDPFKTVKLTIKGRKIATHRSGKYIVATINLKGLPKGAFTLTVVATTVLGHHLSTHRTYHTCVPKKTAKKHGKTK